jgi:EamA domain-containing membrane protein RarD
MVSINDKGVLTIDHRVNFKTKEMVMDGRAKMGLYFGIISLVTWLFPMISMLMCVFGIVHSAYGLSSKEYRKRAAIGLFLSILSLVVSAVVYTLTVLLQLGYLKIPNDFFITPII